MAKPRVPVELSEESVNAALRNEGGRARIVLSVKPKSKKEGLEVGPDGVVVVRVSAPPLEGKANARVVELLAAILELPKSGVVLVRGESARHKELSLDLDVDEAKRRLLSGAEPRGLRRGS